MPVRLLGRLVVVLILDALALLGLSELLPGFTLAGFGAAFGMAVVLGVLNAFVWPVLLRIALPFTVATLGLGALVLNAALLFGAAALSGAVELDDVWSALVVILGVTLITTAIGGVLALDRGDLWYRHVVVRQAKRSKLAIRSDVPGLLLLEIDGLAYDILMRAMRDGNAPALARCVHDKGYRLERWETGWSSQTGACQAGLLHGDDSDMPAFRWWEKDQDRAIVTNHPKDAAEIERRRSDGRGLLYADGASRANILSGDAPHSMLTMSTVLDRDRPGRLGQDYFAYFASPYGVARTALRVIGEVFVERFSAVQQVRRDVRPRIRRDWKYALVRAYATVIQLDLQVAAVTADVLAGRPVVYTTFLAYDEVAHHSGLERPDTLAVLRRVDLAIARIAAAVEHAPRPYELVVLSDHGQSQGATFKQRYGEELADVVARHGGGDVRAEDAHSDEGLSSFNAGVAELASRDSAAGHVVRTAAGKRLEEPERADVPEVSVMASGNLGLVSFPREPGRVTLERIEALRPGLVDALRTHPGIAFVLVRSEADGPVVLGPRGMRRLTDDHVEGEDPLAPFGVTAAGHVRRTDGYPHCPDLVVNGTYWAELDEVGAFEELVGSHGGLGGTQAHPFVLHPPELPWPREPVIGASAVHHIFRGWLAGLGQDAYNDSVPPAGESTSTRVAGASSAA
jgi:uncharacterized membrane protein YvlD (DUF360 family)